MGANKEGLKMKYLWLAITADKYELPIYVADTCKELAEVIGVSQNLISSHISKNKSGKISKVRFKKVPIPGSLEF